MARFQVRDLTFFYPETDRPALEEIDLTVEPGEFLVVCGPSGCGKSTLLRQLKPALTPHGQRTGDILFDGAPLAELPAGEQAQKIGFVLQSPENQLVTDKVWHELAFGLESLGWDTPTIRRRVAEMASFFGIQGWFHKDVSQLSGGQKQLLNLASVMAMGPSVLILDEPTSQLDPIAAGDFLASLGRLNRELGLTVILTEHRLEEAFPLASRVVVLDGGRVLCDGTPQAVGAALRDSGHGMFAALPTAMRVWAAVPEAGPACPVTVREGRDWLAEFAARRPLGEVPPEVCRTYPEPPALQAEGVWFRYEEKGEDVVKDLALQARPGELLAILGGNGAGKTTALKLLGGLFTPQRGEVRAAGRVALLPQDPQTLFVKKTVEEDLLDVLSGTPKEEARENVLEAAALCRLEGLLGRHPYDLSGGEQQRAALAKVLLTRPDVLLLDEPTKGLDAEFKGVFGGILEDLLARGGTVVMVSHDVEFCAQYAHRCALFFDGSVVAQDPPRAFFSGNSFYTTAANRMAREFLPQAVTAGDVAVACGGQIPEASARTDRELRETAPAKAAARARTKLPLWRKVLAAVCAVAAVVLFVQFVSGTELSTLLGADGFTPLAGGQMVRYGAFVVMLVLFALCVTRRSKRPAGPAAPAGERRRLSRRTLAAAVLIVLLIPATLILGETWLGGQKYYFVALLVLLECMVPFFLVFEGRRPQARELVVIAVLCAMGVVGRAVFFMLPQFKPVIAITVIAGVALGGETGFLVGAVTMLVSNIMFSQTPMTPWQMFAMGVIGFLAGFLFRKGWLGRTRGTLGVFGALAAILLYGGILNTASALLWVPELNWKLLMPYYLTGFPMDCVQGVATFLFLWFAGEPMLEKLDRIKTKYGLVEP